MKKLLLALVLLLATVSVITSCGIFIHEPDIGEGGTVTVNEGYLSVTSGYLEEYGGNFASVGLNPNYEGAIPEDLVIPDSINGKTITVIAYGGFENCTTIKSVTLPDTITYIKKAAFKGCTSLTSINIPSSVKYIGGDEHGEYYGDGAFEGCTALTDITLGDNVIQICHNAFYNTGYYNDFGNWDNDVLYIGKHLIKALDLIEGEHKIKEGTVDIAEYAFRYCKSLTGVEIPSSIIEIGQRAFFNSGLESVTFAENAKISAINNYGVFEETEITSITIPDSVTDIGMYVFENCSDLSCIIFGENSKLKTIGDYAFSNCALSSVSIPESVTTIGDFAFEYCELSSITIPKSVKELGAGVFGGCVNLSEISISSDNKYFRVIEGNLYSRDGKTLIQYAPGKIDEVVHIPDTVTKIGDGAFCGCQAKSIKIPYTVTSIGDYAFKSCDNLTHIDIPDTVTSIGYSAFYWCSSLTSLEIPKGIAAIDRYIFDCCKNLKSIIIPNSITKIDACYLNSRYGNIPDISDIYYTGSEEEWNNIEWIDKEELPDNITIHYNYVPEN